ncbi:ribosomal protein S11 [Pyrus ussuriensis x Pyrus communis]|uniref:Ribosomal protein S11 n=1 Tax=Pyrus ussuriensis x Pyrus communis TaxID=2448454 RepID=A0A5N5IJ76_9ROSA|nr:ribosomal protein S11 [Pyrus ussuriensis x Pyrus communis]
MYSSLSRLSSSLIHCLARTTCQGEIITSRSFSISRMPPGRQENFQNGFNVSENGSRNSRCINFVRGVIEEDGWNNFGQNADIVHVKMMKSNTFVTVTDSKGNKKLGASAGSLPDMKGGPKLAKYAAEATAEHVGRMSRNFGLKSVVMKKEGFTSSQAGHSPIVYIEDTTRKPHNGCRLPKQRRI